MEVRPDIQRLVDEIVREFRPEQVILFGSQATGRARNDSDVDLLVLLPFSGSSHRMIATIRERVQADFPFDLMVHTPEAAQERYRWGDPLLRDAFDHGIVMYGKAA